MNQRTLDRHFKIFSIVQGLIILWGGYTTFVQVNLELGWNWFLFLLAVLSLALLSLFTYYLYKNHRLSALWAILVWALQLINIESEYISWTMSLGLALSLEVNFEVASIRLNIIALPMLIWVAYLALKQRELTETSLGAAAVNPSQDGRV